jgi:hypothetical protein
MLLKDRELMALSCSLKAKIRSERANTLVLIEYSLSPRYRRDLSTWDLISSFGI